MKRMKVAAFAIALSLSGTVAFAGECTGMFGNTATAIEINGTAVTYTFGGETSNHTATSMNGGGGLIISLGRNTLVVRNATGRGKYNLAWVGAGMVYQTIITCPNGTRLW